jgi:hypothetical protein
MFIVIAATSPPGKSLYGSEVASCRQSLLSVNLPSGVNPDNLEFATGEGATVAVSERCPAPTRWSAAMQRFRAVQHFRSKRKTIFYFTKHNYFNIVVECSSVSCMI